MVIDPYEVDRTSEDITDFIEWRNTFKKLHKDILLEKRNDMKWDRVVQSDDFVKLEGMEALTTGVIIWLQMWFGELKNNPTYYNSGNKAWFYVKDNDTELSRMELKEYIRECLASINRIKSVDTIDLFAYPIKPVNDSPTIVIDVNYTSISDQVNKTTTEVR